MHPLVHSPTTSTTQTTLKSKWNTFKEWFTPDILLLVQQRRRPSQCSTTSTMTTSSYNSCCCANSPREDPFSIPPSQSTQHKKKPSITSSSFGGGRRPSNASCSQITEEKQREQQIEKLYELYNLAMDEINYAQDSRGSPYYDGDRIAAKEAIDHVVSFYQELQLVDPQLVNSSNSSRIIVFKIATLNSKFDALPIQDEDQRSF